MEHRSRKHEHQGQSITNRESDRHRSSQTKHRGSGQSKRPSTRDELSMQSRVKPPLSGDDDYVRRWLAQTRKEIEVDTKNALNLGNRSNHGSTRKKPSLDQNSFRNTFHETDTAQQYQYPKQKRRHRSSSDSSLIEPVLKPEPNLRKNELKPHVEKREEPVSHQAKKRKDASSESESTAESHARRENFTKRDRHKTRDDRYEPRKKKHKSDKQDGERNPKKRREKKGDKGRASKKAGEELMNKFSSEKVSQDRLTGIKGRIRSPRSGMVDMRYSEPNQLGRSFDRFSASQGRTPSTYRLQTVVPETTSRSSENSTTFLTWSRTQISPGGTATSRRRDFDSQNHQSPIPEPIRRSIESTGIFRDTGIDRNPSSTSVQAKQIPPQELIYQKQYLKGSKDPLECSNHISSTPQSKLIPRYPKHLSKDQRAMVRDPLLQQSHANATHDGCAAEDLFRNENQSLSSGIEDTTQQSHAIMEHHNLEPGEHRQKYLGRTERSTAAAPKEAESLRDSQHTPLSREQIAKSARVKRPATKTAVETIIKEPSPQDEQNTALNEQVVPQEIIKNSGPVDIAPIEHMLGPTPARPSNPAANGESPFQEDPKGSYYANNAQELYGLEKRQPVEAVPSALLSQHCGGRFEGMLLGNTTPISGESTLGMEPTKLEANFIAGIPGRVPSGGSLGQLSRSPHFSTNVEPAPLYLNQIQRQYSFQRSHFATNDNDLTDDRLGVFKSAMFSYSEDNEYDVLEEQDHKDRENEEHSTYEDREEFEHHAEEASYELQIRHPIPQGGDMVRLYESEELEPGNGCSFDGGYNSWIPAETFAEEEGTFLGDQLAEEVPMRRFWRPNRPF
ncbi:hypothetical protein D0Z07_2736 [Hyphodiscus hymeniophilus]|uniref:Uncharacterized protein n=1 Tax=Hyphodiscus hymeniophilus TaxID=353542 RepID=A0A9P7AZ29_9HELO|nr:hypothetical protein D0Z07_2736 [Hyphodiscus hymeniophilus]